MLLAAFMEEQDLSARQVAKAIGCPEATIIRLLAGKTLPSDEMMKQVGLMIELGFDKYATLTEVEKGQLSEKIGAVGGGILGFATISAAVEGLGLAGLSAAGISSGLAALGSVVGGGMLLGVGVAAAIPIAAGAAGYAIIKSVKYLASEVALNEKDLDPHWESVFAGEDEGPISVWAAAETYFDNGCDPDYMFGYSHEQLVDAHESAG